ASQARRAPRPGPRARPAPEGRAAAVVEPEVTDALREAARAWMAGEAYVDSRGNYHVRRPGRTTGPIAPWNREVKRRFPTVDDFRRFAESIIGTSAVEPQAQPEPAPAPAPEPAPEPTPEPTPAPAPEPEPEPTTPPADAEAAPTVAPPEREAVAGPEPEPAAAALPEEDWRRPVQEYIATIQQPALQQYARAYVAWLTQLHADEPRPPIAIRHNVTREDVEAVTRELHRLIPAEERIDPIIRQPLSEYVDSVVRQIKGRRSRRLEEQRVEAARMAEQRWQVAMERAILAGLVDVPQAVRLGLPEERAARARRFFLMSPRGRRIAEREEAQVRRLAEEHAQLRPVAQQLAQGDVTVDAATARRAIEAALGGAQRVQVGDQTFEIERRGPATFRVTGSDTTFYSLTDALREATRLAFDHYRDLRFDRRRQRLQAGEITPEEFYAEAYEDGLAIVSNDHGYAAENAVYQLARAGGITDLDILTYPIRDRVNIGGASARTLGEAVEIMEDELLELARNAAPPAITPEEIIRRARASSFLREFGPEDRIRALQQWLNTTRPGE